MKAKKKTGRSENKRIPPVGPITSREELVHKNLRTELTLAVKRWEKAEAKARTKVRQHKAALAAFIKGAP